MKIVGAGVSVYLGKNLVNLRYTQVTLEVFEGSNF
jgi:hypothetical protein